jgi:hypothetical protein
LADSAIPLCNLEDFVLPFERADVEVITELLFVNIEEIRYVLAIARGKELPPQFVWAGG